MSEIKVAVIGLGEISAIHLAALETVSGVRLCGVCDIDPAKKSVVEGVPFYTDITELLQAEQPDCVHICLPHHLHYMAAKIAVEHGCNVFSEKPLTHNLEQAEKFANLEKEYPKLKLGLCFQNRRNESVEKLMEILQSGGEGAVVGITATVLWKRPKEYYLHSPWRGDMTTAGGGVMINQSIHTLDLMQQFCGDVQSVRGNVCNLLNYGVDVEDTVSAKIQFKNNAEGYFTASVANCRNDSVIISVVTQQSEYKISDNKLYKISPDGSSEMIIEDAKLSGEKFYYGASHAKLIGEFYTCLTGDTDSYIHVSEGIASLALIDAIQRSSKENSQILL